MSVQPTRRIVIGLAATVATLFLVGGAYRLLMPLSSAGPEPDKLLDTFYFVPTAMLGNAAAMFVAALAGTWVARRNFIAPAVCLAAGLWLLTICILHSIAAVADQGDLFEIVTRNVLFLLPALIGAVAGALLGQRLFRYRRVRAHGST